MGIIVTVIASFALFIVYWCALLWLIACVTGWRSFARRFPARRRPSGPSFGWCSLRLWAIGGYNGGIVVTLGDEGIYLELAAPFRCGHPSILFPWAVASPSREWRFLGGTRLAVPLRVDNRTIELILSLAARDYVDSRAADTRATPDSASGPWSASQ